MHSPQRPSLDELLAEYQRGWSGAGFATPEEEAEQFAAGRAMLQKYLDEAPPPEQAPATLLREKMLKMDRGFYVLRGRLDRLDEWPDGTLEIVDYKSGRHEVTEQQVRSDVGLMVYEMLVRKIFPDRPIRIAIHALRPNIRLTVQRTADEASSAASIIDEVAARIAAEAAWHGVSIPDTCTGCDFERICPDWKG